MAGFRGAGFNRFTSNRVPLVSSTAGWLICAFECLREHWSSVNGAITNHHQISSSRRRLPSGAICIPPPNARVFNCDHRHSSIGRRLAILSSYLFSRMSFIRVAAVYLSEPRGHFMDSALRLTSAEPAVAIGAPYRFPVLTEFEDVAVTGAVGLPVLLVRHS